VKPMATKNQTTEEKLLGGLALFLSGALFVLLIEVIARI